MKIRTVLLALTAVFTAALTAGAQCPRVNIGGPAEVEAGSPATVTASVGGGANAASATYTYNWTTSDGIIISGQGTSSIVVDTLDFTGRSIPATVTIGGDVGENCQPTGAANIGIRQKPRPAVKFDEFGTLKPEEEASKLDRFGFALEDDPASTGYLIIYGGKTSLPADFKKRALALVTYVVSRGVANSRLRTIEGGYREQPFVELWIMLEGGFRPVPTPTIPDPNKVTKPPPPQPTPKTK